jgi:hypothetical protein
MKNQLAMLSLAISCAFAGNALAMTRAEYKAAEDRIEADYKVSRDKCSSLKANAKDICQAEAKGAEKTAKAELEAQYKPSTRNDEKVVDAKADAAYDVAKEKCDELTGNNKDVCVKEAKAARTKAKADAKVNKAQADANRPAATNPVTGATGATPVTGPTSMTGTSPANNVATVRKDAAEEKREADYKVAKEKCDALAGNAKDSCESAAKSRYGMK